MTSVNSCCCLTYPTHIPSGLPQKDVGAVQLNPWSDVMIVSPGIRGCITRYEVDCVAGNAYSVGNTIRLILIVIVWSMCL